MFHWICPECGREIPPTVKECPACDPSAVPVQEAAKAPSEQVEVPVETASEAPAPEVVAAAPEPPPLAPEVVAPPPEAAPDPDPLAALAEQLREVQTGKTAAAPLEPVPPPLPVPVDQAAAPPVEAAALEAAPVEAAPVVETATVEAPPVETAPVETAAVDTLPLEAPPVEAHLAETPRTETAPPEPLDEPEPSALESPGLAELVTAVGVSQPPESIPEAAPVETSAEPVAVAVELPPVAAAASEQTASLQDNAEPVALLAQPAEPSIAPLLLAAPTPETVSPPSLVNGVDVAISPQVPEPATGPLATETPAVNNPPSGSRLPMAPLNEYTRTLGRLIRPVAPNTDVKATDAGPRLSLPGPALPPNLLSFQDGSIATEVGKKSQKSQKPQLPKTPRSVPGWLVSFLVMLVLLGLGAAVVFYFVPMSRSNADTKDLPAETQAVAPSASHPLAQSIEVTGFRIVLDPNKKSEIHYVVVNHSAAALSDMTVYVTLRGANAKAGQPPLSHFSFKSPDLAPFEAKEMISTIERISRSITLPDWSDLRAEVQVAQK